MLGVQLAGTVAMPAYSALTLGYTLYITGWWILPAGRTARWYSGHDSLFGTHVIRDPEAAGFDHGIKDEPDTGADGR